MLPPTEGLLVVRTDFSDQAAWEAVRTSFGEPAEDGFVEEFSDVVQFLDDVAYRDVPPEQILPLIPDAYEEPILVLADRTTITSAEMPLLLIDLNEEYGRTFRAVPDRLPAIHANLSIANMDFFEFADAADDDGIFRGFRD